MKTLTNYKKPVSVLDSIEINFDLEQMQKIRWSLENGGDAPIHVKSGDDILIYAKPKFDTWQM